MNNLIKSTINSIEREKDICIEAGCQSLAALISCMYPVQGVFATGGVAVYMGYKQKRALENIQVIIDTLTNRMNDIETSLKTLSTSEINFAKDFSFPILLEFSEEEIEKEKIKMFISGFKYTIDNKIFESDHVLELNDTLRNLRLKDIKLFIDISKGKKGEVEYYYINKLSNAGIISIQSGIDRVGDISPYKDNEFFISDYGKEFLDFMEINSNL